MGNEKRRAVERIKTVLIVLLTLSALGLIGRAQTDSGMTSFVDQLTGFLQDIGSGGASTDVQNNQANLRTGLRPVRIALCNENGRYGVQYEADLVDTIFEEKLGSLLGDALAGAGQASMVSEDDWRAALKAGNPSVYYDFLGSVPLTALSAWLGDEVNAALTGQARRILLAPGGDGVVLLYYCGGDGLFYVCRTDLSTDLRLRTETADYTPNQAAYAFEQQERYPNLDPYVMILPDTPEPLVYQASDPIGPNIGEDTLNQLLKALDFHPQTSSVYQAADGLVVREGTDTLRLSDSGVVVYHAASGQNPRYPVSSEETLTGLGAIVEAARALTWNGLSQWCGSAELYLIGTEQQDDGATVVYFGYLLDGAAVELYEDGYAARVVVRNGYVSDFTLRFRTYQETGDYSAVLPEIQAAAAMKALETDGNELMLCYLDGEGTQRLAAGWIAR